MRADTATRTSEWNSTVGSATMAPSGVCKSFTRICVYAFIYVCMRTCISKGWNVVVAHHFRFPFLQTPTSYSLSGGPIIKLFYAYVCALPANRNFSDSVVGVSLHHVAVYAYMLHTYAPYSFRLCLSIFLSFLWRVINLFTLAGIGWTPWKLYTGERSGGLSITSRVACC